MLDPTNYNRVIIVGNGFDRSLNLPTAYSDFLLWYLKRCLRIYMKNEFYQDECLGINQDFTIPYYNQEQIELALQQKNINDVISYSKEGFLNFNFSPFFSELIGEHLWVDIEAKYYTKLKRLALAHKKSDTMSTESVKKLNNQLNCLKTYLNEYLSSIVSDFKITQKHNSHQDLVQSWTKPKEYLKKYYPFYTTGGGFINDKPPVETLVLNFNYTNTLNKITRTLLAHYRLKIIEIQMHGEVDSDSNPLIFGYGDDTSAEYHDIENLDMNEYLKLIKSFSYFKTEHYQTVLNFIEQRPFEVYIVGHSCGLSDRTLLKSIFENERCINISAYHRGSYDSFFKTAMAISRHFSDKESYRKKVLPFDGKLVVPQVT